MKAYSLEQTQQRVAPRVTGHRGAAGELPENTVPGFLHAARIGCDAVELDVHLASDNVLVVVHDPVITRSDGSTAEVRSLTSDEVCSSPVEGGGSIPTLASVLDVLAPTALVIQIELKGEGVIQAAIDEVRRFDLANRVVFTSFHHRRILEARRLLPGARTGALLSSVPVDIVEVARRAEANAIHLHYGRISREIVTEIHESGLAVVAWGVIRDDVQFDHLFGLEVDAIGSDWPTRLLARRAHIFGGQ